MDNIDKETQDTKENITDNQLDPLTKRYNVDYTEDDTKGYAE